MPSTMATPHMDNSTFHILWLLNHTCTLGCTTTTPDHPFMLLLHTQCHLLLRFKLQASHLERSIACGSDRSHAPLLAVMVPPLAGVCLQNGLHASPCAAAELFASSAPLQLAFPVPYLVLLSWIRWLCCANGAGSPPHQACQLPHHLLSRHPGVHQPIESARCWFQAGG